MGLLLGIGNHISKNTRLGSKLKQKPFDFATANGSQALSIIVNLPVGKTLIVDWGDGTSNSYDGQDATDITLSKTYAGAGIYPIKFRGNWRELTTLYCYSNSLTGDVSGWSALTDLTYLSCGDNSLTGDVSGWSALTKLTELRCYLNSLTGDVSGWSALTDLTYLNCRSNSLTGAPHIGANVSAELIYQAQTNNFSSAPLTVFRKGMTVFNIATQKVAFSTANIDILLKNIADWYEVNAPTANCTFTMNGANMGIPTDGASNADILRTIGYYTAASKIATFVVRTS